MAASQFNAMMAQREILHPFRRRPMRFILGMIVGAAVMLGSAYLHDTGRVKVGPAQAFVNWNTVFSMVGR
jgi:hypothetical protein